MDDGLPAGRAIAAEDAWRKYGTVTAAEARVSPSCMNRRLV